MTDKPDIQKIIDRARKLHRLASNNSNENEAISAAEKLQTLLAEHALSMLDIANEDRDSLSDVIHDNDLLTDRAPWVRPILSQTAKLYFCGYFSTNYPAEWVKRHKLDKNNRRLVAGKRGRSFTKHSFIGTQANIIVTKNVAEYLISTAEALCREAVKKYPREERTAAEFSFMNACSARLSYRLQLRRLDTARDGIKTEKTNLPALQSVYDQAKQMFDDWCAANAMNFRKSMPTKITHEGGMRDGAKAGESIGLDTQIETVAPVIQIGG